MVTVTVATATLVWSATPRVQMPVGAKLTTEKATCHVNVVHRVLGQGAAQPGHGMVESGP